MYELYYGLREKPFTLVPDPAFLYPSRHHQFALMAQVVEDRVSGGIFPAIGTPAAAPAVISP